MQSQIIIIFSVVLLSSILIFPNVEGGMPIWMTSINGTSTTLFITFGNPFTGSDMQNVEGTIPQFIISDKPISLLIQGHSRLNENANTTISVIDPNGKISEFDIKIISGKVEFWHSINVEDPVGFYKVSIPSPHYVEWGFDILSEMPSNENEESKIPEWIRHIAGWWADERIDDTTFVHAIQYLVQEKIMNVPPTATNAIGHSGEIPSRFKSGADWWADGKSPDSHFLTDVQSLIAYGIIQATSPDSTDVTVPQSLKLLVGQTEKIDAENISIKFVDYYTYGNCPSGAGCAWDDDLIILEVTDSSNNSTEMKFLWNRTLDRPENNFGNYTLRLDRIDLEERTLSVSTPKPSSVTLTIYETGK